MLNVALALLKTPPASRRPVDIRAIEDDTRVVDVGRAKVVDAATIVCCVILAYGAVDHYQVALVPDTAAIDGAVVGNRAVPHSQIAVAKYATPIADRTVVADGAISNNRGAATEYATSADILGDRAIDHGQSSKIRYSTQGVERNHGVAHRELTFIYDSRAKAIANGHARDRCGTSRMHMEHAVELVSVDDGGGRTGTRDGNGRKWTTTGRRRQVQVAIGVVAKRSRCRNLQQVDAGRQYDRRAHSAGSVRLHHRSAQRAGVGSRVARARSGIGVGQIVGAVDGKCHGECRESGEHCRKDEYRGHARRGAKDTSQYSCLPSSSRSFGLAGRVRGALTCAGRTTRRRRASAAGGAATPAVRGF